MSKSFDVNPINQADSSHDDPDMDFIELLDKGFTTINNDVIVKGKILSIDSGGVIVDIGYKSEGLVPINEFPTQPNGSLDINVGDEIEVYIIQRETESGLVQLSKKIADEHTGWSELADAFKNNKPLKVKITQHNQSGFMLEYRGIPGFLPFSQSCIYPNENPKELIGKKFNVQLIDFDPRRKRVIFSRKQLVDEEKELIKKNFLDTLKEGDRVKGKIKSITNYGAFIDIGGMDGLLHISDISWKTIRSPDEILKTGAELELVVIKIDKETERISLGLKQLYNDPWDNIESKYPLNSITEGIVTATTDYGAFIELEPGIEGMVHISEMSWTKRINHPSEMLKPTDKIQLKILFIDKTNRRITLGLRQMQPDPWEEIENKYPIGKIITATVLNITAIGALVKVEDELEGFIHKTDLSWNKPLEANEVLQPGQQIEVRVIKFNRKKRKLGLGIKQLTSDPWLTFVKKHKEGTVISGKVIKITDAGVFVELEGGIEGFCRTNQLDIKRVQSVESFCKIGDLLEFKITRLQKVEKKFTLSRRILMEEQEKQAVQQYMNSNHQIATNLGELFQEATSGIANTGKENN